MRQARTHRLEPALILRGREAQPLRLVERLPPPPQRLPITRLRSTRTEGTERVGGRRTARVAH